MGVKSYGDKGTVDYSRRPVSQKSLCRVLGLLEEVRCGFDCFFCLAVALRVVRTLRCVSSSLLVSKTLEFA